MKSQHKCILLYRMAHIFSDKNVRSLSVRFYDTALVLQQLELRFLCVALAAHFFIFGDIMVCTFFGHRQIYNQKEIESALRSTLVDLIERWGVTTFYVGNHGAFDAMVARVLSEFSTRYPIRCYIVLAYLPKENGQETYRLETILPEGIENAPKRYAISRRNEWMIGRSGYVVTYVTSRIGSGAAQFKALAEKRGKTVIELSK